MKSLVIYPYPLKKIEKRKKCYLASDFLKNLKKVLFIDFSVKIKKYLCYFTVIIFENYTHIVNEKRIKMNIFVSIPVHDLHYYY